MLGMLEWLNYRNTFKYLRPLLICAGLLLVTGGLVSQIWTMIGGN